MHIPDWKDRCRRQHLSDASVAEIVEELRRRVTAAEMARIEAEKAAELLAKLAPVVAK